MFRQLKHARLMRSRQQSELSKGSRDIKRRTKMEGYVIAIVVAIPLILIPAALVWYMNVSGILTVMRETRKRRIAREKRVKATERAAL